MSSRSGAVYWVPVSPVRSSVVIALVSPHNRPVTDAMPEVTESSKRPAGCPSHASGSGCRSSGGTASPSAITAVSGRGTASPAWIVVATAVSIACASSAAGSTPAAASGSGCAARCRVAARATAGNRARPGGGPPASRADRNVQRGVRDTTATTARCRPRPARRRRSDRTGRRPPGGVAQRSRSAVAGLPVAESWALTFAAAIATVGPCADSSCTAGRSAPVADQGGAAGRSDAEDLVDDVAGAVGGDRAQTGSPTRCNASRSACA